MALSKNFVAPKNGQGGVPCGDSEIIAKFYIIAISLHVAAGIPAET